MDFPACYFFGFLNATGWPRIDETFNRGKVVSNLIVYGAITELIHAAIALGALRPKIAIKLLADSIEKENWSKQSIRELWDKLDPSEKVSSQPDKHSEDVIANYPMTIPDFNNPEEVKRDLMFWENVLTTGFNKHYHWAFAQGLVWGLSHPKEALARYEEHRQNTLKHLPDMLSHGLNVHSPETLEEFAGLTEKSVNAFQNEIRPLAEAPQALLDLPIVKARSVPTSRMDKRHKTVILEWIRWIAILPAAIGAYCGIQALIIFACWLNELELGRPLMSENVCQLVNNVAASVAFVWLGSKTAPRYHFFVGVILAVGFTAFVSTITTIGVTNKMYGSPAWLIITTVISIVAALITALYLRDKS
jgi:hypothetical protein